MPENNEHMQNESVAEAARGASHPYDVSVSQGDGPGAQPTIEKTFDMGPNAKAHEDERRAATDLDHNGNEIDRTQPPVFPAPEDAGPCPFVGGRWDGYAWEANPHLHVAPPSDDTLAQKARAERGELSYLSVERRLSRLEDKAGIEA